MEKTIDLLSRKKIKLEKFRKQALDELRDMRSSHFRESKRRAEEIRKGEVVSDDPILNDPEVRKAAAALIEIQGILGLVPPSLYTDAVKEAEKALQEAKEKAKERLGL